MIIEKSPPKDKVEAYYKEVDGASKDVVLGYVTLHKWNTESMSLQPCMSTVPYMILCHQQQASSQCYYADNYNLILYCLERFTNE